MKFWAHVRQTKSGSCYVTLPAAIVRTIEKDRHLETLVGEEVRVEVTL